jgi:PIN domain nuclease of toxin-antitoxin system
MNRRVLDSSVVLILLKGEPGISAVRPLLAGALLSAVNAAECVSSLVRDGVEPETALQGLDGTLTRIVPFDSGLAKVTGTLIAQTKHLGLSLGDRACLALALRENLPVFTADRNWKDVNVGVDVNLVR